MISFVLNKAYPNLDFVIRTVLMELNIENFTSQILAISGWSIFSSFAKHISETIYMISVACYQDKYQLNFRLTDQLLHDSLGKECPAAFWHHLGRFTIPKNELCIKTAWIFLQSHCCLRKLPNSDWLLSLRYIPNLFNVS